MAYQRGSGFVGLDRYLSANRGQAQSMGNAIASGVEQQGNAAQGAISGASQAFNTAAAAGTPQYDMGYGMMGPTALRYQAGQTTYGGPKELGDVADVSGLRQQAGAAADTANLATTDAGRAVLLQRQATGTYGQGQRSLDAYLAGRGAGARLEQDRTTYGALAGAVDTAQQGAKARAAQGQADASALSARYRSEADAAAVTQPTGYLGAPVRRTIDTPGTMPSAPPKKKPWHEYLPGARQTGGG